MFFLKGFAKPFESLHHGQQSIENGHLLKGILVVDENVTPFILKKLNINVPLFSKTLDKIVESYPKVSGGQPFLSNNTNQAIAKASTYLKEFGDEYVSIEHLLLALLATKDTISQLLKDNGVTEKDLKASNKCSIETYSSPNSFK